ncbi:hypothetical protein ACJMK2_032757 [Sinanodonta woodiana]|uniref:Uncharacterized protein n=1 Tax=Sinanodonta woodiana TaxID=1069815 RepID=A0ABD3X6B4_SINWO
MRIAVGHTTFGFEGPVEKLLESGDDNATSIKLYDLQILARNSISQTKLKVMQECRMDMVWSKEMNHQHKNHLPAERRIIAPVQKRIEELALEKKKKRDKSLTHIIVTPCIIPVQQKTIRVS